VNPSLLLGHDFGRPANDVAHIFYYTAIAARVDIEVVPPPGWRVTENDSRHAMAPGVAIGRAVLHATGTRFVCGSPARVIGRRTGESETREIELTTDALTIWSLAGPIAVGDVDALDAQRDADARLLDGSGDPEQTWRIHLGLQCTSYVNLTAFLENIYGPVPSGDYKVYRRMAYASTHIYSPVARDAQLGFTGEDRFIVWWNGTECMRTEAIQLVPRTATVRLESGWNRVIVKSSQDGTREWGGRRWGFECTLRDNAGARLKDICIDASAG
jgi:hypothetical protein